MIIIGKNASKGKEVSPSEGPFKAGGIMVAALSAQPFAISS